MLNSNMKKIRLYQFLNVIGFIATIVVNGLANALPLNGVRTGEVADSFPNLFTPADITFAVWGIIYLLLGLFIIYQLGFLSKGKTKHLELVYSIKWSFFIASAANVAWLFAWHYGRIFISVLIMLILLISLIDLYERANTIRLTTLFEKLSVKWAFSIYLGWISVATIANITTYLVSVNWNGFGLSEQTWTMIVLLLATVLALGFVFYKKDVAYALVTEWALFGILLKHLTVFNGQYTGVITVVAFSMIIILASIFLIKPNAFQTQRTKN